MIHTNVSDEYGELFYSLLNAAVSKLDTDSKYNLALYQSMAGKLFEPVALEAIKHASKGSIFENSFSLISGRKFPDIVSTVGGMGIEIKTSTKGSPWVSMGNSIRETSRHEDVRHIFLLFANLHGAPQFKVRRYQDCLCNGEVTHSPRYRIDMNTPPGETIFDKIGVPYDQLRKMKNPWEPIANLHRERLGEKGDVWWLGTDTLEPTSATESTNDDQDVDTNNTDGDIDFGSVGMENNYSSLSILYWSGLSISEKQQLRLEMAALFPQLLSSGGPGSNKYNRAASWLLQRHKIICPSFRDIFTGGKRCTVEIEGNEYINVPTFIRRIFVGNFRQLIQILERMPLADIKTYWENPNITREQVVPHWLDEVIETSRIWLDSSNLTIHILLKQEGIPFTE